MGSAACWQLAKRGARVLGLDQFSPPHEQGSSHGESRIIRQAIGEGEQYVPIVLRAYEIWDEIAERTGAPVLTRCGFLLLDSGSTFLTRTIDAARKHGIDHELLDASELRHRFPEFQVGPETGYFEPQGGFLRPELCISSQIELARKAGAEIRFGEKVLEIGSARVVTTGGRYEAGRLIVCAGAWIAELFPEYGSEFTVYRQAMYWFRPKASIEPFLPNRFPTFIWYFADRIYGFPALNGIEGGIKIATENWTGDAPPEAAAMFDANVAPYFPGVSPECVRAVNCLYTVTPDRHFVIDFHPEHPEVIIASPCSGHGFKHSAAVGEILAQMALDGKTSIDISSCSLGRLQPRQQFLGLDNR